MSDVEIEEESDYGSESDGEGEALEDVHGDGSEEEQAARGGRANINPQARARGRRADINPRAAMFEARSGREYLKAPPPPRRRAAPNIVREPEGIKPEGRVDGIMETFNLFFVPEAWELILQHTNVHTEDDDLHPFTMEELQAFIGVSILQGAHNDEKLPIDYLWSQKHGKACYIATMPRKRYKQMLHCLRFDDYTTREERRREDKYAAIREFTELINSQFSRYYTPSFDLTIDEMLALFRGRASFKVFLKEKPGKYGLLYRILSDAHTRYIINLEPYAGKSHRPAAERTPDAIVRRLVQPVTGSGRNITADRFYSNVDLAEALYVHHNLTLVGTMKSNRKHIPSELTQAAGRGLYSSVFAFTDPDGALRLPPVTLVSYCVKPRKVLVLVSTMHEDATVHDGEKKKPEIVEYYNSTKGGVDTIDQMVRATSCRRGTNRWPVSAFYTLVDMCSLNEFTIHKMNHPLWHARVQDRRRLFLVQLGEELIRPLVELRAQNLVGLQRPIVQAMETMLGRTLAAPAAAAQPPGPRAAVLRPAGAAVVHGRCHICVSITTKTSSANKTRHKCAMCDLLVCCKHSTTHYRCTKCEQ